jgi:hypothetical protein
MVRSGIISMSVRTCMAALAASLLFPAFTPGDDPKAGSNPNVRVWVHLSRESFKPGDTGEISITISPAEGYHVNANPPVELRLDSTKAILFKGVLSQTTDRNNGYLSTRSPIRQSFYLPSTIKPGFHVLKGVVTYFYCSDSEGWCQRFRQPITLSFNVTQ